MVVSCNFHQQGGKLHILTLVTITPPNGLLKVFCDTIAKELAPLNIGVTIVEPGAHQTSFGSGMTTAPVMEAYENTPAGEVRRAIAAGTFPIKGDVDKSVQAMIDSVEVSPAPLRLALGGDAYRDMRAALVSRLESLDAQKELALASEKND